MRGTELHPGSGARRPRHAPRLALAGIVALLAAFVLPTAASAHNTVAPEADLSVSATASPSFARGYTWSIQKSVVGATSKTAAAGSTVGFDYTIAVTKSAAGDSAWKVAGSIVVKNTNSFAVTGTVSDDIVGETSDTCTITGGATQTFAAGSTASPSVKTLAYTCTFSAKPSYTALTSSAKVTWTKTGAPSATVNSGSAPFQFGTGSAGNPSVTGDQIYVWDQFNHGTVDAVGNTTSTTSYPVHRDIVVPSGVAGCVSVDNTATFSPENAGYSPSNSSTVTTQVCPTGHALTIAKTVNPAFSRSYTWSIAKSVDQTAVTTGADSATVTYTVVATKSAATDSGWTATGTISVGNPNSYGVTNVVVSEQGVDNGGTCAIDGSGTIGALAAGASTSVTYTCTYAAAPSKATGSNTASVAWTVPASGNTPASNGSASVSQPFAFGTPTTVLHDSANVSDLFNGGAPAGIDGGQGITASKTFTYSRSLAVPATACMIYDNTATVVPTDQPGSPSSSTAETTVCRTTPPATPPVTPPVTTTSVPPVTPPKPATVTKTSTPSKTTVSLAKHADASTVKAGGTVSFTIVWKNTGKAKAKNVVICDDLPNQMTFVSASGATFSNGKACWKRTFVAKGATLTFRVVAHVDANVGNGALVNVATATASNAPPQTAKAPVRALRNQRVRAGGVTG